MEAKIQERSLDAVKAKNEFLQVARQEKLQLTHNQSETIKACRATEAMAERIKNLVVQVIKENPESLLTEMDTRSGLVRMHEENLNVRQELREGMTKIHKEILNIGIELHTLVHAALDSASTSGTSSPTISSPESSKSSQSSTRSSSTADPTCEQGNPGGETPQQDWEASCPSVTRSVIQAAHPPHALAAHAEPQASNMHGNIKELNSKTKLLALVDSLLSSYPDTTPEELTHTPMVTPKETAKVATELLARTRGRRLHQEPDRGVHGEIYLVLQREALTHGQQQRRL